MGRKEKFPGLRQSFANHLKNVFKKTKSDTISGKDLIDLVTKDKKDAKLTEPECEELRLNSFNYLNYAVDQNILIKAPGRSKYRLSEAIAIPSDNSPDMSHSKTRSNWESLLHYAATTVLSNHFNGLVVSPSGKSQGKWTNPDMLILSNGLKKRYYSIFQDEETADCFNLTHSEPDIIISSVELKYRLKNNRTNMFNALTEAAANGSWAHESWLVFMEDPNERSSEIDPEFVRLGMQMGVGIIEIMIQKSSNESESLSCEIITKPFRKSHLMIHEFKENRSDFVDRIAEAIKSFDKSGQTGTRGTNDHENFVHILLSCHKNLFKQPGFSKKKSDNIENWAFYEKNARDRKNAELILNAAINHAKSFAALTIPENATEAVKMLTGVVYKMNERHGFDAKDYIDAIEHAFGILPASPKISSPQGSDQLEVTIPI